MTTSTDHYTILTSEGKVARTGYGPVPAMRNLENYQVLHNATKEEIENRQEVINGRAVIKANCDLGAVKQENRSDAFALKKLAAKQFLRDVPEIIPTPDLAACLVLLNHDEYEEIHDEYEATHHLIGDTSPWDLSRAIVSRAKASFITEVQRRVTILEAEASLLINKA